MTTLAGLLVQRVQDSRKGRRGLNTTREQFLVAGIKLARRDRTIRIGGHSVAGLDNLAGLLVNPLDLVLPTINPLGRKTTSLGINLGARLRRILTRVILEHIEHGVIRVHNVAVFQQVVLASTINNAASPLTSSIERVLVTREERVVVERRELAKAFSFFGGEEQPIPVHVLRQVLTTTTRDILHPGTIVRRRCNLTKQAVSIVLGTIREDDLRAVVTGEISVDQRLIVVATVNITIGATTTEGALELQLVVTIAADDSLSSLSDPLVLTLFGHLALDPVLQRSLITVGPATSTNLSYTKIISGLVLNLSNCIVRQVGAINFHARGGNIRTVRQVHQARGKRTLSVVQVPEQPALDRTKVLTIHRIFNRIITVHHVMADLLTESETHIRHTVRSNFPAHATRRVERVAVRTHVSEVVTIQLGEVIRIRVIHPHTNLLTLRSIRVSIKLDDLALRVVERLHLDAVVAIRTGGGGVNRRSHTALFRPLRVNTHTLHRNRPVRVIGTRVHRKITTTLVNHVTLNRLLVILDTLRLFRTINLDRLIREGVARHVHHGLIHTFGVLTRVVHSLASFILRGCERGRRRTRRHHRLRKRRNQRKRQRSSSNRRAATACDVILLHKNSLRESVNETCSGAWEGVELRAIPRPAYTTVKN